MIGRQWVGMALGALLLLGGQPLAQQQAPAAAEPVPGAATTQDEIQQFLEQLERGRHALELEAEGQGSNALQNTRMLLDSLHQQHADERLDAAMALLIEAEAAAHDGRHAWALERLNTIEEILTSR